MKIKFSDILELFEMVNFGSPHSNEGYINKSTGKTYFYSEFGDNEEELPDDIDEETYLFIPHKSELNQGNDLAFDFTLEHLPSHYENVRSIFRQKGAYARFKSLLESSGKIELWYKFEADQTEKALRQWCEVQDVKFID
ncbi:hypothetical protein [Thalassotalea sp. PS06]|uniref:hypothetical protein n=1 Tax=Thalassotalea sp. PS06 TaxID=2594005 RepID=UPI0011657BF1|nr:hypothetical protein [Thalassotalea sp. PS06]QDO99918.1 hypothetical protein FNC98_00295 [Thalassotalea sp. PS06]